VSKLGEHAVVLGAGMGGLLAARVLSEFYGSVTLVERDVLPDGPAPRRGVAQGRHVHAFLSSGSRALGRLFPGLLDELVAAGAHVCDEGDLSRICIRAGGYEFNRSGKFVDPMALVIYVASQPFLEFHVRQRVQSIKNVCTLEGHEARELVADERRRVIGARVVNRDTGIETVLDAALVVDAMGRGASTPAFLDHLGYGRPVERRSQTPVRYASQLLRIPPDMITEKMTLVVPMRRQPIGGGILAYENNTMMLTVAGFGGHEPPTDLATMIASAAHFAPPSVLAAIHVAQPVGNVSIYRYPGSVWRRYEKMPQFPTGLLVFGDAICSLNPSYGQGMTVAALQAVALQDCLARGDADLSQRFFGSTAKQLRVIWQLNRASGGLAPSRGTESRGLRRRVGRALMSWWGTRVLAAAANDAAVAEGLLRVQHLVDAPTRLQHPPFMMRVLAHGRTGAAKSLH
jgi:2-polyprenyl-6-methoxyphenol hydroxylase-like FAD-dependent oxidoreductase